MTRGRPKPETGFSIDLDPKTAKVAVTVGSQADYDQVAAASKQASADGLIELTLSRGEAFFRADRASDAAHSWGDAGGD